MERNKKIIRGEEGIGGEAGVLSPMISLHIVTCMRMQAGVVPCKGGKA